MEVSGAALRGCGKELDARRDERLNDTLVLEEESVDVDEKGLQPRRVDLNPRERIRQIRDDTVVNLVDACPQSRVTFGISYLPLMDQTHPVDVLTIILPQGLRLLLVQWHKHALVLVIRLRSAKRDTMTQRLFRLREAPMLRQHSVIDPGRRSNVILPTQYEQVEQRVVDYHQSTAQQSLL